MQMGGGMLMDWAVLVQRRLQWSGKGLVDQLRTKTTVYLNKPREQHFHLFYTVDVASPNSLDNAFHQLIAYLPFRLSSWRTGRAVILLMISTSLLSDMTHGIVVGTFLALVSVIFRFSKLEAGGSVHVLVRYVGVISFCNHHSIAKTCTLQQMESPSLQGQIQLQTENKYFTE